MKIQVSNISGGSIAASAPLVNSAPAPRWIRLVLKVGEDLTVLHFRLPTGWGQRAVQQWALALARLLKSIALPAVTRAGSAWQVRFFCEARNLKTASCKGPKGIEVSLWRNGSPFFWIPVIGTKVMSNADVRKIFADPLARLLMTETAEFMDGCYCFTLEIRL